LVIFILYRKKYIKLSKKQRPVSETTLIEYKNFQRSVVSERVESNPTILNTLTGDIAIPGYLELDFERDIRVQEKVAEGGEGSVSFGIFLNLELRKKYDFCADALAVKEFNPPRDAREAHDQEF